jgi:hypothetical protein
MLESLIVSQPSSSVPPAMVSKPVKRRAKIPHCSEWVRGVMLQVNGKKHPKSLARLVIDEASCWRIGHSTKVAFSALKSGRFWVPFAVSHVEKLASKPARMLRKMGG